jgi:cation transport regulator ChaC
VTAGQEGNGNDRAEGASNGCWYFAYGSNMCRATFIDRRGMKPLATRRARLDGYRLCFDLPIGSGERGVANLIADAAASTWGVAYLLDAAACAFLDRTEGLDRGFYNRLAIEIVVDDGERLTAFAYQGDLRRPERKPSARYLGLLLAGAREQSLPTEYVAWLESFPLAIDERLSAETA